MEKNKVNFKKGILIGGIVSAALFLGFLGSYAYFISIGNNNQNQSTSVQTGNMELVFEDGNNGINESLNFGESITKTFTIENTGSLDVMARMNWKNLRNTYTKGSLTYTLSYSTVEDGEYTEIVTNKNVPRSSTLSMQTLINNLEIPSKTKYYYKLKVTLNYLEDIDQTSDLNAMLSTEFIIEEEYEEEIVLIPKIVRAIKEGNDLPENSIKTEQPNYALAATTDETRDGLYAMEDDYGTSYYFRGASENNYVKFGDFYWRIIRINGDGSLRIIYDGTSAHANGEASEDRVAVKGVKWNNQPIFDSKHVGYMFGGNIEEASISYEQATSNENDSNAKQELEKWYEENIPIELRKFVSDNIFCNDRKMAYGTKCRNEGFGYPRGEACFASRERLYVNNPQTPILTCPQQNDAFTVSDKISGNAKLKYPVGLITADEVALAGTISYFNTNQRFYLYKGITYWSMSPSGCNTIKGSSISNISSLGELVGKEELAYLTSSNALVPVINLTSEYVSNMIGDGTIGNEYRLN